MSVYQIPLPLFPRSSASPHDLQGNHLHVVLGVARELEVDTDWAGCLRIFGTVPMFSESFVQSSTTFTNVLFFTRWFCARQQVHTSLVCTINVLIDFNPVSGVVNHHLLHNSPRVCCWAQVGTQAAHLSLSNPPAAAGSN